jgi:hypothetical protein
MQVAVAPYLELLAVAVDGPTPPVLSGTLGAPGDQHFVIHSLYNFLLAQNASLNKLIVHIYTIFLIQDRYLPIVDRN